MKYLDSIPPSREVLLIDLSWLLYKGYYVFSNLSIQVNGMTRPTGHIYEVLRTIKNLHSPDKTVVLCMDSRNGAKSRKEIVSSYKSNRDGLESMEFNPFQDVKDICKMSATFPRVYFAKQSGLEADDILYSLAKRYEPEVSKVVVYSGDDDLLQVVSSKIEVLRSYSSKSPLSFRVSDVIDKYGVEPDKLIWLRAIFGDKSDNLPGISRFPRKLAKEIVSSASSFEEMFTIAPSFVKTVTQQKYVDLLQYEYKLLVEKNYEVMKLHRIPDLKIFELEPDYDLLNEYGMTSILNFVKGLKEGSVRSGKIGTV